VSSIIYDEIGRTYGRYRRPDDRIGALIAGAIGDARRVVNVGAGAGAYEPSSIDVVAVEPSRTMIAQRTRSERCVQGVAGHLPFADNTFDVALAVLTVHHWPDARAGLAEMRRVSSRQVVVTWDPSITANYWLITDYLPEIVSREADLAALDAVREGLDATDVRIAPVPSDCTDGFLAAYWRRPERYLDADARAAISALALLDETIVERAMRQLASDLADGTWKRRHADLRALHEFDAGYRIVVGGGSRVARSARDRRP
jgi:SAM-dependent methyltransferase